MESILIALVSPEGAIDRVVRRETIDPEAGLKEGWRWLPVIEETGEPGDTVEGEVVYRRRAPVRRMVRKSVITARLIDAGKMEAAYAALTSNADNFGRWIASDRPAIYHDDPDALALLQAIGADPAVIMAEGA